MIKSMSGKSTFSTVIKNRGFLNLWINQILVQLSGNCLNFALIIWVFKLTDSNIAISLLLFCIYLPAVIFGLFSGVLVDVIDRRKIIMTVNLLLSLSFVSLIFFKDSYPVILAITFFMNSLGQFYAPAEASAIPMIVKRNQLLIANSIFSATVFSSFLIGFALAGSLINHLGINFVFGLGGVILSVAFFLSLLFPPLIGVTDKQGKKLISALIKRDYVVIFQIGKWEIGQTFKLIKGKLPVLSSIAILAGAQMVIGIIAVLAPGFLEKTLHIKATDASMVIIVPLGLGIVLGGLILGKLGANFIRRKLVSKAIIFAGLLFFLEGISPVFLPAIRYFHRPGALSFITQPPLAAVLAIGSFFLGIALVCILVPSQTVLQENTPDENRGKVFSVLGVAMSGMALIPVLLSGILADMFGTTPIFIGLGSIIIIIGLFGLKPNLFFQKHELTFRVRQFLGLGHWGKDVS